MRAFAALAACAVCLLVPAAAYPSLFANKYATSCQDQPAKAYGAHGAPIPDKATTFGFYDYDGTAVTTVCPGGEYGVSVHFGQKSLSLVTANAGYMGSDKRCYNRVYSGDKALYDALNTKIKVPCSAAGNKLVLKATSASSPKDAYHQASASIPVGFTDGDCADIAKKAKCDPVTDPATLKDLDGLNATDAAANATAAAAKAPATIQTVAVGFVPINVASAPGSRADGPGSSGSQDDLSQDQEDALMGVNRTLGDDVQLRPVVKGALAGTSAPRELWAFLHGALMMAAFALLLPLGLLLARHRWIFGRDPRTGKVSGAWVWVHGGVQLLAILCGAAGVTLAILGRGWKSMPSVTLYEPHKWFGVATLGAALLQFAAAAFKPAPDSPRRGAWEGVHKAWGRVTAAAGVANVIIGTLLMHDYYRQPHAYWLAPAAALLGAVGLAAALLESVRMQMLRTHRYYPKTDHLFEVEETYHKSSKRGGGGARGVGAGANGVPAGITLSANGRATGAGAPGAPSLAAGKV